MANITTTTTPQVTEIDVNEVLREYGLDNIEESSTIIQNGDNIISIPSSLEPPPVATDRAEAIEEAIESGDFLVEVTTTTRDEFPSDIMVEDTSTVASIPDNLLDTNEALTFLPVNTRSNEVDETTSRFSGADWFKAIQNSTVILAGLGGIGSWVALILSRMKPLRLFVYDDDVVERVNMSGQLYSKNHIGKKKVDATALIAKDFSEYPGVLAVPTKFTKETAAGDIMICGFDNMEARKTFFNVWLNHVIRHSNPENCLFIDGRLDMESFQVFCIQGNDSFNIKKYSEEYLFDDWQAESVACSVKQTTYCANMIGAVIVNLYTNFISNTLHPLISRELPFKTFYDASIMYFKTEG